MVDEADLPRQCMGGAGMVGPGMGDDLGVGCRPGEARHGALRSFHHGDFALADLVAARAGRRVAVCLPARNEAATLGPIVSSVRTTLTGAGGGADLVDDIVVVDDGSEDGTAAVASRRGARVITAHTAGGGKGQAMAIALAETDAELLVFLDADVENFDPHYVTGLLGPLVFHPSPGQPDVALVKGFYDRPLHGEKGAGGRVTELVARPVIDLLFPHLGAVRQPLAGETAATRTVLDKTGLAPGYGVELALLIDVAEHFGVEQVAQVDLGVRIHRNRPLTELRPQATDVLGAALQRAGVRSALHPEP
ncbi:MAG TPA: glucosyl-3-phosphoglycerate synthase [Acidimicrobiales bacterium]|nr:glucosyl-3-phosphoglycerate synthase [Acidimicrobiales bacterium]